MIKDTPHFTSELDGPIREVHRALRGILPPTAMTSGDEEFLAHVVDDLDWLYRLANEAIVAERGPRITWPGTIADEEDFPPLVVMTVDMDEGTLSDPAGADCLTRWSSDDVDWKATAPAQAALAYQARGPLGHATRPGWGVDHRRESLWVGRRHLSRQPRRFRGLSRP